MSPDEQTIHSLREALRLSPDNAVLRALLADALLRTGRGEEAESEYRAALAASPTDLKVKLGLAKAFYLQDKRSAALVVLEDLTRSAGAPAEAHVLHARLLAKTGDTAQAAREYRRAIALDPTLEDAELAAELGLQAPATEDRPDERVRVRVGPEPDAVQTPLERPKMGFDQIGGMEKLKQEIRLKILAPLQHPEIYQAYGKPVGGGILMYGPPGCGKTHLARATAGEAGVPFLAVGLHEILDMWLGQSERNLHAIFEQARAAAPCILFFDEVDALGASRSEMRHSAGRQVINQFLAELDGIQSSNEGVLILAATNAPWHVDAAFRRPGRFDRVLFVPPPDAEARAAILEIVLKGKPAEAIQLAEVAKKTEHCSGADLKALVDRAIEAKLEAAIKLGKPSPLTTQDLLAAAKAQAPTTREWFSSARNYALYANQGGVYDDILAYMKHLK